MRLYKLAINNADYDVTIKEVTTDEVRAEVNGEEYTVRIRAINDLKQESTSVVVASPTVETNNIVSSPLVATKAAPPAQSANANAIKAPIPGQVISVNVNMGEKVLKGQKILVLEAMKLENILTAEQDGVVQKILVKEGEVVNQDQDLVIIA